MKATFLHASGAIALTFTIAACYPTVPDIAVPAPTPTPSPTPSPVATQAPAQLTVAPSTYENYMDAPQTPGTWTYANETSETLGLFGTDPPNPVFIIRCDKETGRVGLGRRSAQLGAQQMKIETETATRTVDARSLGDTSLVIAEFDARDPLLDSMAITKGRFAISTPGAPSLFIPAWVEVSRVIEDCR